MLQQIGNGKIIWQVGGQHGWSYSTQMQRERTLASHRDDITGAVQSVAGRAASLGANIGWLLLIPVLAIFFLRDKRVFADALVDLIEDEPQRAFARRVLGDLEWKARGSSDMSRATP